MNSHPKIKIKIDFPLLADTSRKHTIRSFVILGNNSESRDRIYGENSSSVPVVGFFLAAVMTVGKLQFSVLPKWVFRSKHSVFSPLLKMMRLMQ